MNLKETYSSPVVTQPTELTKRMTQSYTILYADDDQDDLMILSEAFSRYTERLRVVHACDGAEALATLEMMKQKGDLPCLIIMDINMPGMDGKQALKRIKESEAYSQVPVVLFSTSSSRNDQVFAEEWGANFLTKPSNYNDLEGLVQHFVNQCLFTAGAKTA